MVKVVPSTSNSRLSQKKSKNRLILLLETSRKITKIRILRRHKLFKEIITITTIAILIRIVVVLIIILKELPR